MLIRLLSLLLILASFSAQAKERFLGPRTEEVKSNKGKIYLFYGWNSGWYTNSNIRFQGDNYDFVLNDVVAHDRQTAFDFGTYFNPSTITIPQTNFRIGFFINHKIDISFGIDHMKYVMDQGQRTTITGSIDNETIYNGNYSDDDIVLDEDFLTFEHTDGLNYLNFEITRNDNLLKALNIRSNEDKIKLDFLVGFGAGGMLPRSNIMLMENVRHDEFHLAGYGIDVKTGLNLSLFKHFYLRSELKGGFAHLTDIRTTPSKSDRARQRFLFGQLNFMVGFSINPFN